MYLIVGLGNPTKQYEKTRHNVGFDVIDELIEREQIAQSGVKSRAMYGKGIISGQKAIVAKPLTFMNLSGEAVGGLVKYYKTDPREELIVIYDDIDLDPGNLRIRKRGSAGGHNGIKNIIEHLGTQEFCRIRVGVGAKPRGWDLADYVLSRFPKEERALVDDAIDRAVCAVKLILEENIDAAMNMYNKKV